MVCYGTARDQGRGFTLVELLVVIAIISLLLSILVPSLRRVKTLAQSLTCLTNTGQLSKAMCMYTDNNKGRYWLFNHVSASQYWHYNLRPFFENIDQIRFCPKAVKYSDGWGATDMNWGWWGLYGSYGMNLWLTPNDPDPASGSYYGQFCQIDPVTNRSFNDFFWKIQSVTTANTPTVTDSPWVGHWPLETDPPPQSYYYGTSKHVGAVRDCEFMGRVCFDRHEFAVNSGFCDGSSRRVRLPDLYRLQWAKWYRPTIRTDIVPPPQ